MKIPIYQVDAFTTKVFGGNPAAVCPLNDWLAEHLLQQIGMENNQSETAFIVQKGEAYHIRWFTPTVEVDLCGHATLASAHVIFRHLGFAGNEITMQSKSGILTIRKSTGTRLTLDFPATRPQLVAEPPACILAGLGITGAAVYKGPFDYMVVAANQAEIEKLQPDFRVLAQAQCRGVVVTAKGTASDFVSRCFYPQSGIDEDPVTGSAHTMMTPYWAEKLGRDKLSAIQLSKRKGHMDCELAGDRVYMTGEAVTYMKGEIEL